MKKILCLMLCAVMLLSLVLTAGCSATSEEEATENISKTASKSATTLTMWLVSEKPVSEETQVSISEALNKLTQSKFKTQVILKYFTEDAYYDQLTSAILKNNGKTTEDDEEPQAEETYQDEHGLTTIKYPDAVANQVDIIYIGTLKDKDGNILHDGEAMYNEFAENGWLKAIDDELTNASKKIKEYISPTLLSAAQKAGVTYAVPNNNVIGEYSYMLVNKELCDKYSQQGYIIRNEIKSFFDGNVYSYLSQIMACEDDVLPVDATYEDCLRMLAHYWAVDSDTCEINDKDFSIFGTYIADAAKLSRGEIVMQIESLFANEDFRNAFLKLNEFRLNEEGKQFFKDATHSAADYSASALKFVNGDQTDLIVDEETGVSYYDDTDGTRYYAIPVGYPTASSDDIYGNMFGVCSYTKSLSRSMEIITYLNTDATVRNLLQYGIENQNYRLDEDGRVVRLNEDYMMDVYATGNAFIAYPEPGMNPTIWENGKIQNRGSLVDPMLGFDLGSYVLSTIKEKGTLKPDNSGYALTYTSGYTKDMLSVDPALDAFFDASDAAGTGVYAYVSSTVDGQNILANIYVYNNICKGTFGVTSTNKNAVEAPNGGANFNFNYTDCGEEGKGYEISIVNFACKKTFLYDFVAFVEGIGGEMEAVPFHSETGDYIEVDLFNNGRFTVDAYEYLTYASIFENKTLYGTVGSWFDDDAAKASKDKKAVVASDYVLCYKTSGEERDEYTFVVYRKNLTYETVIDARPVIDGDALDLQINFLYTESTETVTEEGAYIIAIYKVSVDPTIDFSLSLLANGNLTAKFDPATAEAQKIETELTEYEENAASSGEDPDEDEEQTGLLIPPVLNIASYQVTTTDPNFKQVGDLDFELIRFMEKLDADLTKLIRSCKNYAELEKLVGGLSKMLEVGLRATNATKMSAYVGSGDVLGKYLGKSATSNDYYTDIYMKLSCYLNSEAYTAVSTAKIASSDPLGTTVTSESTTYRSPYAMYYAWLTEFGYLPQ